MGFVEDVGIALAIGSYWKAFRDYFSPKVTSFRKRLRNEYFEYNLESGGDLLFWRDILRGDFHNLVKQKIDAPFRRPRFGDLIELQNACVSRWVPLFPGKSCSKDSMRIWNDFSENYPPNHESGLEEELMDRYDRNVLSGFSNAKLLPRSGYYLLNASSSFTPNGVPVLVSTGMYERRLQEAISKDGGVDAKITGVLTDLPREFKDIVGESLSKKLSPATSGIPRIAVKVTDISGTGTVGELRAFAWTLFNEKEREMRCSPMMSSIFNPLDENDLPKAIKMIRNYETFLGGPDLGGKWTASIEFDETMDWLGGDFERYELDDLQLFMLYYRCPLGRIFKNP